MIFISYGVIKSASTYTKVVLDSYLESVAADASREYLRLTDLDCGLKYNFIDKSFDLKLLDSKMHLFSESNPLLIKTHAPLSFFQPLMKKYKVAALCNFRHPADVMLSLVDAANKDLKKGIGRFSKYTDLESAKKIVSHQFNSLMKWQGAPFSASIYYDDLVNDPLRAISRGVSDLCKTGLPFNEDLLGRAILNVDKTKVAEFNKGVVGRRFEELEQHQREEIDLEFQDVIKIIDARCSA